MPGSFATCVAPTMICTESRLGFPKVSAAIQLAGWLLGSRDFVGSLIRDSANTSCWI
jgi:hypothetical protein